MLMVTALMIAVPIMAILRATIQGFWDSVQG